MGTVARHEFGHYAGWLGHPSDQDAVMHIDVDDCETSLDEHDIESMDTQYSTFNIGH